MTNFYPTVQDSHRPYSHNTESYNFVAKGSLQRGEQTGFVPCNLAIQEQHDGGLLIHLRQTNEDGSVDLEGRMAHGQLHLNVAQIRYFALDLLKASMRGESITVTEMLDILSKSCTAQS